MNKKFIFLVLVACIGLLVLLFWKQLLFVLLLAIIGYLLLKFYGGSLKDKLRGVIFSKLFNK